MDKELLRFQISAHVNRLRLEQPGDSERLRTPYPAKDLNEFFPLLAEVMRLQQSQDGIVEPILLTEEMPDIDDNISGERITYSLHRRLPGVFEQVNQSLASNERRTRNRKAILREIIPDPDNPGLMIHIYGQDYDNFVNFIVWARTNKVANDRAVWFENLMEEWRWYFEVSGIKMVSFEERGMDIRLSPENRKVVGRPFRYFIRTEKITIIREAALREIAINGSL
jgi:hypothetical protein